MARHPARPALTADQAADAERIHAALLEAAAGDLRQLAETLAATTDETLCGAKAIRAAAAGREQKATTGAAAAARPATDRPSSRGGRAAAP